MKEEQLLGIIGIISEEFGITVEMLMSKRKTEEIVKARHTLYKTLHRLGMNKTNIGKRIHKDHTSVMHGICVYHNLYDTDDEFRSRAKAVEIRVNQYIYEQTKK